MSNCVKDIKDVVEDYNVDELANVVILNTYSGEEVRVEPLGVLARENENGEKELFIVIQEKFAE